MQIISDLIIIYLHFGSGTVFYLDDKNNSFSIRLDINEEYVKTEVARQIEENLRGEMLFMDIDEMERVTCMDRSFLTKNLLHDPRIRQYQRRKSPQGKRHWLYKPTIEAILDIVTNEWDI